jgi:hypothetical protein
MDNVVSIGEAKWLKRHNLEIQTERMYHYNIKSNTNSIIYCDTDNCNPENKCEYLSKYPAPDLSELLAYMPESITVNGLTKYLMICTNKYIGYIGLNGTNDPNWQQYTVELNNITLLTGCIKLITKLQIYDYIH